MTTSLLDLVGILLIGLVGALSVTTMQSQPPPPAVSTVADALDLSGLTDQQLVGLLAAAAAITLLTKSVLSSYLNRRVLIFLANRQALVSARLCSALLSRPLLFVMKRSSQETAFALMQGTAAATVTVLGMFVILATELALLAVIGVALLLVSPWVALGSIVYFALVALALQRAMGSWASRVGSAAAQADISSLNVIQQVLQSYREIIVSGRRTLYSRQFHDLRWDAARLSAEAQFIGMFPKYLFEGAMVVGAFLLAAALFTTQNAAQAVGTLALFLAAATRVMPSILRLQGASLGLRGAAGAATSTFDLATDLGNPTEEVARTPDAGFLRSQVRSACSDFSPSVSLRDIDVQYPGQRSKALEHVSIDIAPGRSLALVGRSGAGKSTLADIILGILLPDHGQVLVGGVAPGEALSRWPGCIAYVPQDVVLANGTIRENVALGLPKDAIEDELVWEALDRAQLAELAQSSPDQLNTRVGERGTKISGGQRQRLGIARALYTRPRLLVLDEATSALDVETERAISQTLSRLEGVVTTVVIAHRLSTVKDVDEVAYVESGRIVSCGTFLQVAQEVPEFHRQASLSGLL